MNPQEAIAKLRTEVDGLEWAAVGLAGADEEPLGPRRLAAAQVLLDELAEAKQLRKVLEVKR